MIFLAGKSVVRLCQHCHINSIYVVWDAIIAYSCNVVKCNCVGFGCHNKVFV